MSPDEFTKIFDKVTRHFRLPPPPPGADMLENRANIYADWFRQLQHYHADAVYAGVDELLRTEKDGYWPTLGKLLTLIKGRLSRYETTRDKCQTCGGSTWIEATPWKSNHRVYTGFVRCPDCGVPAPNYKPYGQREELTVAEYAAWRAGTLEEPAMPLSKPNRFVLEALQHISYRRGLTRIIDAAPQERDGAA